MVALTTVGSANINPSGQGKGEDGSSSEQIGTLQGLGPGGPAKFLEAPSCLPYSLKTSH